MDIQDLVQKVKDSDTEKFDKMNKGKIALILRIALQEIKNEITNSEDNIVVIPKLGRFRTKFIEKEEDGQKKTVKRIIFMPAKKAETPSD